MAQAHLNSRAAVALAPKLGGPLPLGPSRKVRAAGKVLLGARAQFREEREREDKRPAQDKIADLAKDILPGGARDMREGMAKRASEASRSTLGTRPSEDDISGGMFDTSGTAGFTKKNELFVGRMAMLGFAAAVIGEFYTGTGPLGQLSIETGIPVTQAPPLILAFSVFMIFGAFTSLGAGMLGYRQADPNQAAKAASRFDVRGMFGLPSTGPLFGFTRPVEYLHGRIAQLGFAACILGEIASGKGPVGQLNLETGIPSPIIAAFLFALPALFLSLVNLDGGRVGSGRRWE